MDETSQTLKPTDVYNFSPLSGLGISQFVHPRVGICLHHHRSLSSTWRRHWSADVGRHNLPSQFFGRSIQTAAISATKNHGLPRWISKNRLGLSMISPGPSYVENNLWYFCCSERFPHSQGFVFNFGVTRAAISNGAACGPSYKTCTLMSFHIISA